MMAVLNQDVDFFLLGLTNYAPDGYSKNAAKMGGYAGRIIYCWECLFDVDLSSIPAGSTITAVTIDVNISDNNTGVAGVTLRVHEQNKNPWADNGISIPKWATAPNQASSAAWPTALSSVGPFTGTGLKTLPTSANLVSWFQTELDSGHTNNGLVLTYYNEYFAWWATVGDVDINVTYTAPSSQRRVMVIS